jgi:hypothetical protein
LSTLPPVTKSMKRREISAVGRERLRVAQVAAPTRGPRERLFRASAVSLNSRDQSFLDSGGYTQFALPFTPDSDTAGVAEAFGATAANRPCAGYWRPCGFFFAAERSRTQLVDPCASPNLAAHIAVCFQLMNLWRHGGRGTTEKRAGAASERSACILGRREKLTSTDEFQPPGRSYG